MPAPDKRAWGGGREALVPMSLTSAASTEEEQREDGKAALDVVAPTAGRVVGGWGEGGERRRGVSIARETSREETAAHLPADESKDRIGGATCDFSFGGGGGGGGAGQPREQRVGGASEGRSWRHKLLGSQLGRSGGRYEGARRCRYWCASGGVDKVVAQWEPQGGPGAREPGETSAAPGEARASVRSACLGE